MVAKPTETSAIVKNGVAQQIAATIDPHIPALRHLFPLGERPSFFSCCSRSILNLLLCDRSRRKAGLPDCLNHVFHINSLRIISDIGFPFRETDFCFSNSLQPFQSRPHSDGARSSGHSVDS